LRLDQRVLNRLVLGLNAVAFRRRRDDPFLDRRACYLGTYAARAAEVIVIVDPHMLGARRDKPIEPVAEVLNGVA
jgi:hypothetical protein